MQNNLLKAISHAVLAVAAASAVASVQANEVIVTSIAGPQWFTLASENTGTTTITNAMPRSGNGSIELTGNRTRVFGFGDPFSKLGPSLGLLDELSRLTFDWAIAADSIATLNPDYTPALRVTVIDGNTRSELIWEGADNGTYGKTARDTWYSTNVNDTFSRTVSGQGVTTSNGSQVNLTLAGWEASNYFSNAAFVSSFSVGAGSPAGVGYHAFVDNVTIDLKGASNTYNFELPSAAVPEPGSLALLGLGLVGAVFARRKQRA